MHDTARDVGFTLTRTTKTKYQCYLKCSRYGMY